MLRVRLSWILRIAVSLLIVGLAGAAVYYFQHHERTCQVCGRPIHEATFYRIFLKDGEKVDVCCPRCGLHFQQGRRDVVKTEVADFDTGERFPSEQAFFVENSSIALCCPAGMVEKDRSGAEYIRGWDRCLPSLNAFRTLARAQRFAEEHGGEIKVYSELLQEKP